MTRPLRIGLTGGIGSGKTTVSGFFAGLGIPVVDADDIARALLEPGAAGFDPVVAAFGPEILDDSGRIDRARLRRDVFADAARRRRLEAIVHPLVRAGLLQRIPASGAAYCIVSIPILVESGLFGLVDRVLVVDSPEGLQRARVMQRPGWTADDAEAAMRSQATRETRLRAADDVIVNDGGFDDLRRAVEDLHRRYLTLSGAG